MRLAVYRLRTLAHQKEVFLSGNVRKSSIRFRHHCPIRVQQPPRVPECGSVWVTCSAQRIPAKILQPGLHSPVASATQSTILRPTLVTESEYIAELKAQWPKGPTASRQVLSLACLAVQAFPNSAMLWFLRGQLMWVSPKDYIFSKLDAITSFERAIELDPHLDEACRQFRQDGIQDATERRKSTKRGLDGE